MEKSREQVKDELIIALQEKIEAQDRIIAIMKAIDALKDQKIELYKEQDNARI